METPVTETALPSLSLHPTLPSLPPVFLLLLCWIHRGMEARARGLYLPDVDMQGLRLGDPGGEVFWLEDLEQSGGLWRKGVLWKEDHTTDLGKKPQSFSEGLTWLQTTMVWLLLVSKE